jgi:ketosteroid isomerase-like protein
MESFPEHKRWHSRGLGGVASSYEAGGRLVSPARPWLEYAVMRTNAARRLPRSRWYDAPSRPSKPAVNRERFIMHSSRSRFGSARMGALGFISFGLLGFSLSFAFAQAGNDVRPPPAGFAAVDAAPIAHRIDQTTTAILAAFNRRDRDAYLAHFAADALLVPDGGPLVTGRSGAAEMYLQAPLGLRYEPMVWADRQLLQIGAWIIETGLVDFQFRLTPESPVLGDPRQTLSIWEEDAEGGLRVKVLAWNRANRSDLLSSSGGTRAAVYAGRSSPTQRDGGFDDVLAAEERFHRTFMDRRLDLAAAYYAEDGLLISGGTKPVQGRAAILRHLEGIPRERMVQEIERVVAHVEGDADHVLVVNLFRWIFVPAGAEVRVPIAGKGVHVWERGRDGTWRILFDLPNASQPSS